MKLVRKSIQFYKFLHVHGKLGWRPAWDVYETENDLIVLVEMAGMQQENLEINVDRKRLLLRGSRCRPTEHEVKRIHHMEIDFGACHLVISLPEPIEPNGLSSTFRDGFLLIRLPKVVKRSSHGSV